jgi:periplasmic protein thiol:disulfide oxidoreductases, DsbE subfamily
MKRLLFIVPLGVFVGLIGFFIVALQRDPKLVPSPLIGKPAPVFTLPRLDAPHQTLSAADLRGEVTLLNVWATWCMSCRVEHPMLMAIARSGEAALYGMDYKDQRDEALALLARTGNPYRASAFDADGRVAIDWGVYGTPETFLLDRAGVIRYKHVGPITPELWEGTLLPMIRQLKSNRG